MCANSLRFTFFFSPCICFCYTNRWNESVWPPSATFNAYIDYSMCEMDRSEFCRFLDARKSIQTINIYFRLVWYCNRSLSHVVYNHAHVYGVCESIYYVCFGSHANEWTLTCSTIYAATNDTATFIEIDIWVTDSIIINNNI